MSTSALDTTAFKTVDYVYGSAVNTLDNDDLIAAIKRCEQEIDDLKEVRADSTAVKAKIKELKQMRTRIVEALDAR